MDIRNLTLTAGTGAADGSGGMAGVVSAVFTGGQFWAIALRMALILLTTFAAARLFGMYAKRSGRNNIHFKFIYNIVILLIYVAGILAALSQINGFETGFGTLLAGSGIVALTIGLAAQESFGNIINGMMISLFKPFEVGDRIQLVKGGITGYVEDITLRHTVIRTFINSRVIIPNSAINSDMIENSNFWDGKASSFVDVAITYDSDLALAQEVMARVVTGHPDYVDTRPPERQNEPVKVYVRGLSLYGVELRASMWTESIANNFDACSDVRREIKLEFDRLGIKIAHSQNFDPMTAPPQS